MGGGPVSGGLCHRHLVSVSSSFKCSAWNRRWLAIFVIWDLRLISGLFLWEEKWKGHESCSVKIFAS